MKTEGLCSSCNNSNHCVLTNENGVLECEEFFTSSKPCCGKVAFRSQVCVGTRAAGEDLQD